MTDTTDDGWPEEYRDPRTRPHPDIVRVTVEGFEQLREDTQALARDVADGQERPAVVSFRSVADLRRVLTDRRVELLRALLRRADAAESITALADELDRDYRPVHEDVNLLEQYGLLFLIEEGRTIRPYVPYERIHLDVEIVGNGKTTDSVPA